MLNFFNYNQKLCITTRQSKYLQNICCIHFPSIHITYHPIHIFYHTIVMLDMQRIHTNTCKTHWCFCNMQFQKDWWKEHCQKLLNICTSQWNETKLHFSSKLLKLRIKHFESMNAVQNCWYKTLFHIWFRCFCSHKTFTFTFCFAFLNGSWCINWTDLSTFVVNLSKFVVDLSAFCGRIVHICGRLVHIWRAQR